MFGQNERYVFYFYLLQKLGKIEEIDIENCTTY